MEVIATKSEVQNLLNETSHKFILFPEDRNCPIRMNTYLPKHWVDRGIVDTFEGVAKRGEYYTLQIGVFAKDETLNNLKVTFSDLISENGRKIEKTVFATINLEGVDLNGFPFRKVVNVNQGKIQPLWIGAQIPQEIKPGIYEATVSVIAEKQIPQTVKIKLQVTRDIVKDFGDSQPEKMSRLRWLNSTIGSDPTFIVKPFTPVEVQEKRLMILGREIELSANGLPKKILSYFTQELTSLSESPQNILDKPIQFYVRNKNGVENWESKPFEVQQPSKGQAHWTVQNESDDFYLFVGGVLEYEGMLHYKITLVPKKKVNVEDIGLKIPMSENAATHILGLGFKGQKRPARVNWKWDIKNHHEGFWLGNIHKGLQVVLRDENYERPLNTNFYQNKPLNLPLSWYNDGKGGIRIKSQQNTVIATNYSGTRHLAPKDTLHFNVRFLITPFKTIDTKTHFNTRFVHKYVPVDSVKEWGGTVVNIHHANEINPYINYPFFNLDQQSDYIQEAHHKGIKVKLYNTIRELTYKCYELFALRSLSYEVLNDGEGGGHSWLQEHLRDHYHKAWHAWRVDDAAILNKGTSRWTNYYIEGLNWLAKNQEIDGLYLDDIAFSRETVKRMVSVLNKHRDEVVIDLHSANQFNPRDGFINSAFLYMEHFPFVSRLWFGEYFEYDLGPDYWLTEVSGLPFGLMGEMLEKGGHPYRGLLYGMTTRLYGKFDPRPIWKLFDEINIAESRMVGYWVQPNPVKTNHDKILATTYIQKENIFVALASWAGRDEQVDLNFDWNYLGITQPEKLTIFAPEVEGIQKYQQLMIGEPVLVPANQGLFVLFKHDDNQE